MVCGELRFFPALCIHTSANDRKNSVNIFWITNKFKWVFKFENMESTNDGYWLSSYVICLFPLIYSDLVILKGKLAYSLSYDLFIRPINSRTVIIIKNSKCQEVILIEIGFGSFYLRILWYSNHFVAQTAASGTD